MRPDDEGGPRRELGAQLRRLRHARGLSLKDVAERAGMSFQLLGQIERDGQATTTEKLLDVLLALDGRMEIVDATIQDVGPLPEDRADLARAFLAVLPYVPAEEIEVLRLEVAIWRRRYEPRHSAE